MSTSAVDQRRRMDAKHACERAGLQHGWRIGTGDSALEFVPEIHSAASPLLHSIYFIRPACAATSGNPRSCAARSRATP